MEKKKIICKTIDFITNYGTDNKLNKHPTFFTIIVFLSLFLSGSEKTKLFKFLDIFSSNFAKFIRSLPAPTHSAGITDKSSSFIFNHLGKSINLFNHYLEFSLYKCLEQVNILNNYNFKNLLKSFSIKDEYVEALNTIRKAYMHGKKVGDCSEDNRIISITSF